MKPAKKARKVPKMIVYATPRGPENAQEAHSGASDLRHALPAGIMSVNITRRRRWAEEIERLHGNCLIAMANATVVEPPDFYFASSGVKYSNFVLTHHSKRLLALLRRVRRCPECRGQGAVPFVEHRIVQGRIAYTLKGYEPCDTCKGTGKL